MKIRISKLLIFLIIIGSYSCFEIPGDMSVPKWDVDIRVPIVNKTYYVDELLEDYDFVTLDPDGGNTIFYLETDTLVQKRGISEFLQGRIEESGKTLKFPLFDGAGTVYMPFSNGIKIDSAYFKKGSITLEINNNSSQEAGFEFEFPGFKSPDGETLVMARQIPSNQSRTVSADFSSYSYSSAGQDNNDELMVNLKVQSSAPGESASVDISISETQFEYVRGVIPSLNMESLRNALEVPLEEDIKTFRDKLNVRDPEINFSAIYNTQLTEKTFEVELEKVKVIGVREVNESKSLTAKDGGDNLGTFLIQDKIFNHKFNNDNSNLSEFIRFLPDTIILGADVAMNPENKTGSARIDDTLEFNLSFRAGSYLNLDNVLYSDTIEIDWDDDTRDYIDNGRAGDFVLELTNNIPIEVMSKMHFCGFEYENFFDKDFAIEGAEVDDNGFSLNPAENSINITLDSTEIDQVSKAQFIIFDWEFSTTNNDKDVAIRSKDWLKMRSYCTIKYHLVP